MSASAQRGLSLIELVIFIVVLGIGIAGMAIIYNQITLASVDPVVRKQALAIAGSLMEEIQLQPFTFCDPDDANVFTAPVPPCGTPEGLGTEGGETRYGTPRFDNVSDYQGFHMPTPPGSGIRDATNTQIAGLDAFVVDVAVAAAGTDFALPLDAALKITVSVTHPIGVRVDLQGYRMRYAPNSP